MPELRNGHIARLIYQIEFVCNFSGEEWSEPFGLKLPELHSGEPA